MLETSQKHSPRVQPSARREGFSTIPDVKWDDVGALQEVQADMDAAVCEPIRQAELFRELGWSPSVTHQRWVTECVSLSVSACVCVCVCAQALPVSGLAAFSLRDAQHEL